MKANNQALKVIASLSDAAPLFFAALPPAGILEKFKNHPFEI